METCIYGCLVFILFILSAIQCEDPQAFLKRDHSLTKPYHDGKWDFIGSTIVTNQYVRLTPDHQSRRGAIWNTVPNQSKNWELHVHFKVHGKGSELFGDGMAVWYAKERLKTGPVFGNADYFNGLAIFMDTYSNHNGPHNHGHPYVSAMVNNGTMQYDHDRDGTHTELDGCESQFRNLRHDTFMAVRYEKQILTVSMDIDGKNSWKKCFQVQGVHVPTGYYFGASAATGDLADNHDVISMKLYDITSDSKEDDNIDYSRIVPSADFFASPRDHIEDPGGAFTLSHLSGWRLFFVIVLIIIGVCVCAVVGYVVYAKHQEDNRRRLY